MSPGSHVVAPRGPLLPLLRRVEVLHAVEVLSSIPLGEWFVYSRFDGHDLAQGCADRLRSNGYEARVRPVVVSEA